MSLHFKTFNTNAIFKETNSKLLFVFLCFIFSDLIQCHGWGGQGQVVHDAPRVVYQILKTKVAQWHVGWQYSQLFRHGKSHRDLGSPEVSPYNLNKLSRILHLFYWHGTVYLTVGKEGGNQLLGRVALYNLFCLNEVTCQIKKTWRR